MHRSVLCLLSLILDILLIFTVIISVVTNSLINKYPALSLIIFLGIRSVRFGNSLVVQWLVLSSFTAEGSCSIPDPGAKILQKPLGIAEVLSQISEIILKPLVLLQNCLPERW